MNDFPELQNQLKKLHPAQPSEDLAARIERALAEPTSASMAGVLPRSRRVCVNWLSLGLGLAAAAMLLIFVRSGVDHSMKRRPATTSASPAVVEAAVPAAKRNSLAGDTASPFRARGWDKPPTTTPDDRLVPVGLTQLVYSTRDEGLHFPPGSDQPMRRMRSQKRETLQWRNPATGASLRVSYPSEEISLIPISGQ